MQAMGTKRCDEVLEFSVQEGKTSRGDRKKKILKLNPEPAGNPLKVPLLKVN